MRIIDPIHHLAYQASKITSSSYREVIKVIRYILFVPFALAFVLLLVFFVLEAMVFGFPPDDALPEGESSFEYGLYGLYSMGLDLDLPWW